MMRFQMVSIAMARSIRTTVSVPEELYAALAKTAQSGHVSTAWVIRDALRVYLGEKAQPSMSSGGQRSAKQVKTR